MLLHILLHELFVKFWTKGIIDKTFLFAGLIHSFCAVLENDVIIPPKNKRTCEALLPSTSTTENPTTNMLSVCVCAHVEYVCKNYFQKCAADPLNVQTHDSVLDYLLFTWKEDWLGAGCCCPARLSSGFPLRMFSMRILSSSAFCSLSYKACMNAYKDKYYIYIISLTLSLTSPTSLTLSSTVIYKKKRVRPGHSNHIPPYCSNTFFCSLNLFVLPSISICHLDANKVSQGKRAFGKYTD